MSQSKILILNCEQNFLDGEYIVAATVTKTTPQSELLRRAKNAKNQNSTKKGEGR